MSTRKLGRGLDMLIAREEAKPEASPEGSEVLFLDPQRIRPNPEQPRKQFSMKDLEELRASIAREGILQPLLPRVGHRKKELRVTGSDVTPHD